MRGATAIQVLGETWHVPRGFGRAYACAARECLENTGEFLSVVVDLLMLVGYAVTTEQVAGWGLHRRVEAVVYAGTVLERASDNSVPRHPQPSWLPERPWQGPREETSGISTGTPVGDPTDTPIPGVSTGTPVGGEEA